MDRGAWLTTAYGATKSQTQLRDSHFQLISGRALPGIQGGIAMPSSRGSSQPRGEPSCPALQVDSLPSEPPGRPKNIGVGSLPFLQRIFPIQRLNQGLLHCRWVFYQLSYQGSPSRVTIGDYKFLYLCGWKCVSLGTKHK